MVSVCDRKHLTQTDAAFSCLIQYKQATTTTLRSRKVTYEETLSEYFEREKTQSD